MSESYKILYAAERAEVIEKKSRFIANMLPVETEEEAIKFIEEQKKKYWNARHNCYAFVIGKNNELQRFSDDGEPGGTAGKPMLEVLLGEGIHNVVVVVTRYFGGVLLGTGGLVRAYSRAVKEGLEASVIKERKEGFRFTIKTDYNGLGRIQYIMAEMGITNHKEEYSDLVEIKLTVAKEDYERFIKQVTEATSGKAQMGEAETCWFLD